MYGNGGVSEQRVKQGLSLRRYQGTAHYHLSAIDKEWENIIKGSRTKITNRFLIGVDAIIVNNTRI